MTNHAPATPTDHVPAEAQALTYDLLGILSRAAPHLTLTAHPPAPLPGGHILIRFDVNGAQPLSLTLTPDSEPQDVLDQLLGQLRGHAERAALR